MSVKSWNSPRHTGCLRFFMNEFISESKAFRNQYQKLAPHLLYYYLRSKSCEKQCRPGLEKARSALFLGLLHFIESHTFAILSTIPAPFPHCHIV